MPALIVKRNKVFFSYTLRDGIVNDSLLSGVYAVLVKMYDVFIDLLHNDSIDKQARVLNELRSSQYVFVLKTPMIEESGWVDIEIAETKKMGIPLFFIDLKEGCSYGENVKKITSFVQSTIKEIK